MSILAINISRYRVALQEEVALFLKLRLGNRPFRRRQDQGSIFREHARRIAWLRRFPRAHAPSNLFIADLGLQLALVHVEQDHVAIAHRCDRAAQRSFWRDMPRHEPMRGATKPAIGQERDRLSQSLSHNRPRHAEHLPHARTALGAFITDHHDVARSNLLACHRRHSIFFRLEDPRRAAMLNRSWPLIFATQPSGAILPFKITSPPVFFSGFSNGAMTSCPGVSIARSLSAEMLRPVTVSVLGCRCFPRSSRRVSSRTPPARCMSVATKRPE